MVNTDRLTRELEKRGLTPVQAAWHLGISEQCFCRKMQSGRFGSQDMQLLMELMELQSPESIFLHEGNFISYNGEGVKACLRSTGRT